MKNKTKKMIELTPEWVLTLLSDVFFADGNGKATVRTTEMYNSEWINLALDTLKIKWELFESEIEFDYYYDFEFQIEDIKEECPSLYRKLTDENIRRFQNTHKRDVGLN